MNKKSLTLLLFVLIILSAGVTFGYLVSRTKTNEITVNIASPDITSATLTPLYAANSLLLPSTLTATQENEVYYLQFSLLVESDTLSIYHLDTELPDNIIIETDGGGTYNIGQTYTITLRLSDVVDYTSFNFYLYVTIY